MERRPHEFLLRELEGQMLVVREALGRFVGSDPDQLAMVPNATAGVNAISGTSIKALRPVASARSMALRYTSVLLFNDTFTNYFEPEIGLAAVRVLNKVGFTVELKPYLCCGRTLISQGLLRQARHNAQMLTQVFYPFAAKGKKILFCEPSCLSAVQEDNPSLLRGEAQGQAQVLANSCMLFEDFLEHHLQANGDSLAISAGPSKIIFHGHCHQKAMGLDVTAKALLSRIPKAVVVDADAGCCGMAGSFGYMRDHYEVSRAIGERKLFPICRQAANDSIVVAAGTSCRHQVAHFTGAKFAIDLGRDVDL